MTTTPRTRLGGWLTLRAVRHRVMHRWHDAPVRSKFFSIVLVAGLLCVVPLIVAIGLQLRLADVRGASQETNQVVDDLRTLDETLLDADAAVRYAILGFDDPRYREEFEAGVAAVPEQLAQLREHAPPELDEQVGEVEAATEAQLDSLDTLATFGWPVAGEAPPEGAPSLPDSLVESAEVTEESRARTDDLQSALEQRVRADQAEADEVQAWLGWATLGSMVVVLLAVAGGMAVVTKGVARRLELLNENGLRFLRGEPMLDEISSADEIGQLSVGIKIVGERLDERRLEAVAATRAKDEFLSNLSHELRTPLTAVIGYGQVLESDDLPAESLDSARRIVGAGHHLLALIDELLDIAKIESGHLAVSIEPLDVGDVVAQATSLVQPMAAAHAIEITSAVGDGVVAVADRQRLTQVLLNLLSNAVKYNRSAGKVHLSAERRADALRVSVADTGPGIAPADLERLFRPFERLGADDSGVEGSGIGLALSKRLVEAMGGTLGVDTEVGRGSTFWIDLAIVEADLDGATPTDADPGAEPVDPDGRPGSPRDGVGPRGVGVRE